MSSTDLVLHVIACLERQSIPYMLVGSYSSNFYGRPRMTQDADFVIAMSPEQFAPLREALGPDFHLDPQLSFETITMSGRYVITHRQSVFKFELFLLKDDPFNQSRFQRRRKIDFEGRPAWLPSPEDVIIQKLLWSPPKDIEDVSNVIALQRKNLDLAYIRHWTDQQSTREVFERLLAQAAGS